MPKYFFTPDQMCNGSQGMQIIVSGETAHHMRNVLRMQAGDKVTLCDGNGTDYIALLVGFDKGGKSQLVNPKDRRNKNPDAIFRIMESYPCETEPRTKVTLYQGMPKGDKMELIIQKCVELGITKIVPVITSCTVARAKDCEKKTSRYLRVAESAAGQSMRGIIPTVCETLSFENALEICAEGLMLVAYEEEKIAALKSVLEANNTGAVNIWIGPEGGFTTEEVEALKSRGAISVSLGARILRTETAAIATVAQVICLLE